MSREVTHDATGPLKLTAEDVHPDKGDIAVCRCGLSDDHPFCDGSHRATEDEADGVRYKYVDGEPKPIARIEFVDGDSIEFGDGESSEFVYGESSEFDGGDTGLGHDEDDSG